MLILYRLFFPLVFLFFIPGLIWKLIRRPGYKKTYWERLALFSAERKKELKEYAGCTWIHAVSVGETNLALTVLKQWTQEEPDRKFVLSTTTTTGQEIARNKVPGNTAVIFCPIDFAPFVRKTLNILKPSALVIFETELWPNMVRISHARGVKTALVNTRISDKSFRGYHRFRSFFSSVLKAFDVICAQTRTDEERLTAIEPEIADRIVVTGNIKFDQAPSDKAGFDFSTVFGEQHGKIIIAASTHNPEDALIIKSFLQVRKNYPSVKLVIVPRHAERGNEIEKLLLDSGLNWLRRSNGRKTDGVPDVLLADTTGELAGFIKSSDLVIMGKTLAGNDEGQNIIEPSLLGKPVISGPKLKNFRQAIDALKKNHAVRIVDPDSELPAAIEELLADPARAEELGKAAERTMLANRGALQKTVSRLKQLMNVSEK